MPFTVCYTYWSGQDIENMNKKINLEIEVLVTKEKKGFIQVRMHVAGMMTQILRTFKTKDQQDLVKEYAKYYILNQAGVETYPLAK